MSYTDIPADARVVLDLVAPRHGRTSCHDTNTLNGFCGTELPRCNRCALIELLTVDPNALEHARMQFVLYMERIPFKAGDACRNCAKKTDGPRHCGHCGFDLQS